MLSDRMTETIALAAGISDPDPFNEPEPELGKR